MRILFAGTPQPAVTALESLRATISTDVEIVGVLTRQDAPTGRRKKLTASPVADYATHHRLPVIKANRLSGVHGQSVLAQLDELQPDLGVVVAYGALLPADVLAHLRLGWINLHFSLLPKYRGAAPVQQAMIDGRYHTGMTVFQLDEGLDSGAVWARQNYTIDPEQTAGAVLEDMATRGGELLAHTVETISAGTVTPRAQTGDSSYAPKLSGVDGLIDANQPAERVLARINGTTPEPGAWGMLVTDNLGPRADGGDEDPTAQAVRVKLGGARQVTPEEPTASQAGNLIVRGKRVVLTCAEGSVEITAIQPAGKKMMPAINWARGQNAPVRLLTTATAPDLFVASTGKTDQRR
ncbi:methionyl-tRNA formyltransferase [Auritidibacter ignavus]|uniref:Methionyl-tRNA formyltransferase n=1 Tax=Auritidibacter ignavus TaxID=678932 RepID=A0AAJ6DCH1_9MICC|nr:methionyl-tRNA formyltransferase [Auritidibacter ignavus]WGH93615.1 methionyl-tRNA formyltransferase [Auritidibacter ignavus]